MKPRVLGRVAAGDASAVEECLKLYGGLVWSIVKRLTGDAAEAEDAVQEVFIDLWQAAAKYDPAVASESTFITMITRRRLIDRYRKRKRNVGTTSSELTEAQWVAAPQIDVVELQDESAKAAACFGKLTENAQAVLSLSIHQGRSHSEISAALALPLGSVKSVARRALLQLRDCMQRRYSVLPEGASA